MRSLEWKQLVGKIMHGNICLWLVMKELSISSAQRSMSSQILCYVLARYKRTPNQTLHGNKDWSGSKLHRNTETLTELTASQRNSSGIFSLNSIRCISVKMSKVYCCRWDTREISQEGFSSCRCSNDISCGSRDNEKRMLVKCSTPFPIYINFGMGQWSFLGPGSEKEWYSISADSPQGEWDTMAEKMMLEFSESGHPVFRATSPLSRGQLKGKGHGKLSRHPLWEGSRVPYSCQAWSTQTCLWIVMIVLTKIFHCNNKENEYKSYHNKTDWVKFVWMQDFCMMLKSDSISWRKTLQNSHNSQMQWHVVSTPCQVTQETKKHRNQKVGSKGTQRLGPYWKLQPVACTVSTELTI